MSDTKIKWRVPKPWTLRRTDGKFVRLDLAQDGNGIVGTANLDVDVGYEETKGRRDCRF